MDNKINDLILTAGPSITDREINYVTDAVAHGWNEQWASYLYQFQKKFADYVGVKHALTTSSCTGAMHLILKSLGIKPGDEVIIPELTWIATAAAVKYVGATPVFCDVDPESWTMLPESVEKLITVKTKVIMPVHLYGHPCDMEPLWDLAKKNNLFIVEDAAQSIGASYHNKYTGSLGDAAAFSFQGAKAIVTGEGGILVTNNEMIYKKSFYFGDHCRDEIKTLFNLDIGFKYKMSNIQAALGLAQIERISEIVTKKRQLFYWYHERLQDMEEISLNVEKSGVKNIFWMTSLILKDKVKYSREEFMSLLKSAQIDSRPIFHPLSSMPMFEKANNPIAYHISQKGINLPSGYNMTEEEVDYICQVIKKNISTHKKNYFIKKYGWLDFKEQVRTKIINLKNDSIFYIPLYYRSVKLGLMRPITYQDLYDDNLILILKNWREKNQNCFPVQSKVTFESTRLWLKKQVLECKDRILFLVFNQENKPIAHLGLFRFDYHDRSVELDNVILGDKKSNPFTIVIAHKQFVDWSIQYFKFSDIYLKVFSDNFSAMRLNIANGFNEINRFPLYRVEKNGVTSWDPLYIPGKREVDRYFVCMKYQKRS